MIVKALHKQLKEKSVKTRQCCFNMLTELVNVLPGALTQHIPVLIPGDTAPLVLQVLIQSVTVGSCWFSACVGGFVPITHKKKNVKIRG